MDTLSGLVTFFYCQHYPTSFHCKIYRLKVFFLLSAKPSYSPLQKPPNESQKQRGAQVPCTAWGNMKKVWNHMDWSGCISHQSLLNKSLKPCDSCCDRCCSRHSFNPHLTQVFGIVLRFCTFGCKCLNSGHQQAGDSEAIASDYFARYRRYNSRVNARRMLQY